MAVNCAAIPENLLESELFGHEKGAFTGALQRRIGKIEEANGGTLLLDEITEMSPALQAKLLRVLQEKEIDRVGGSKPVSVNFRLITTSNRSMSEAIGEKKFREDLYFRINVIHLALPPLRQRPKDLSCLTHHFIEKYAKANQIPVPKISEEALAELKDYTWPGNIRELENVIHRAVLVCEDSCIRSVDLGLEVFSEQEIEKSMLRPLVGRSLDNVDSLLIQATIDACEQNEQKAADTLGIALETLQKKTLFCE